MAERSAAGLLALLPPPVTDGAALDAALDREIARGLVQLRKAGKHEAAA
jgi:hypothetical protein